MTPDDPPDPEDHLVAANDNGGMDRPDPEALRKVNDVVVELARIIGRRMAREDFAKQIAANNNAPKSGDRADDRNT
ncbi:hypothetical protein N8E89_20465 (plasmid) [Phyllobacterium sp. A18/5-2]|uniref:hypothetical protein n=1 Tax=Phyllobacterium sp. A18/5-2 TaxID=2978392 RepID=UPI0021C7D8F9|nr:hypothetical protein [Phyllobacterium sp. A18/5-2]UXN66939.1 hypothetical protein N8E89_20465 [Phyllobacterium sp. A18/5-2]